ncbi:MAG: cytochrome c biogenesis protein ResB [Verrucomicrobia bacterium]|jgi:hypothetical protein|nr:cytochrome c biogenesis protein ResB [Verrucomicrobiota bacterium]
MSLKGLIDFFSSLRLTVVCLVLALVLVFVGTVAQVELGLYQAQNDFFRRFFVYWAPGDSGIRIPVFPGGYLVGGLLLVNLTVVAFRRFAFSANKSGIWLIHLGLILLFVGQLLTDLLSVESMMHLREGETRNYSERPREAEVVLIERSGAETERVIAVPEWRLKKGGAVPLPGSDLTLVVRQYFRNSSLERLPEGSMHPAAATLGFGASILARELPHVTEMDRRDVPSVIFELKGRGAPEGTWLASEYIDQPQPVLINGKTYELAMRPRREYKPYSITLLDFTHDKYPGTEIPRNFSSRVRLQHPAKGEDREVLIYMNNPLRYDGATFYQASFDTDNLGSVLQVVRNPSWLTPYLSCALVSVGLVVQFLIHLVPFLKRKVRP